MNDFLIFNKILNMVVFIYWYYSNLCYFNLFILLIGGRGFFSFGNFLVLFMYRFRYDL